MMKRMALGLAVLMTVLAGGAGEALGASDQYNAVTYYRRAFERLEQVSEQDWDAVYAYMGFHDADPTAEVRDALARATPIFNLMHRGARQPYADFELDYDLGFELTLPHLSYMRQIAKLAAAQAQLQIHDGDASGAAGLLSVVYHMSEDLNNDRTIIGSLVGNAIFAFNDKVTQAGFDRAAFSPTDAARMHEAMSGLSPIDPFEMAEGVFGEREMSLDWIEEVYENPSEEEYFGGMNDVLASMDRTELDEELERYEGFMNKAAECFLNPDREAGMAELKAIEKKVEEGAYGKLIVFAPSMAKLYERMMISEAMLGERLAMLEDIAGGKKTPREAANAAHFYQSAIEIIELHGVKALGGAGSVNEEEVQVTNGDVEPPAAEVPAPSMRDHLDEALGYFREGSSKQRCDFELLRPDGATRFQHAYIAGMHEGFILLEAETLRLMNAQEHGPAAEQLGVMLRAMAHLANDEPLLSAVVSHDAFTRAATIIEQGIADGWLTTDHARALASDLNRMGRKDPFGYIGSVIALRTGVAHMMLTMAGGMYENREHIEDAEALVGTWTGDQLLCLLAVHDHMTRAGAVKAAELTPDDETPDDQENAELLPIPPAPMTRLRAVIDADQLERTRSLARIIAPRIAQKEFSIFRNVAIPSFAAYDERQRTARSDLRSLTRLLRKHAEPEEEEAGSALSEE